MIFLLRCNVSVLLFGKCIACIAIHVGVAMELQMFRPYGAGSVARESLFVVREKRPHPLPSPDRRGVKQLGDLIAGLKSPLSGEI